MATSGSKSIAVTSWDTLRFSWSETSQSTANNTTTISWKMELIAGSSGRISSTASKSWSVTVNGTKYSGTNTIGISNNATKTLASGSTTIAHNSDGTKTFSYSFSQEIAITFSGSWIGTKSDSGSGTLDKILRFATIISAPNFDDEDNPVVKYSNPAGNAVTSLELGIFGGDTQTIGFAGFRDISKTDTSYTFNLTDSERDNLRSLLKNAERGTVRFALRTKIGDSYNTDFLYKTVRIINAAPTLSPTVEDIDSISKTLTGNPTGTIINGYSVLQVNSGAAALKKATIESIKISCGNKSITTSSGTLSYVNSGTVTFTVTDSRGYTTTKNVSKTFINYIKPTCILEVEKLTIDGKVSGTVSGYCYNGSFGAVNNDVVIQYRYKTNDGSYGSWTNLSKTYVDTAYSASFNLTGLDYRSKYTFQARITDSINTVTTDEIIVKTTPIFDWGENDFNFNVKATLQNGIPLQGITTEGENKNLVYLTTENNEQIGGGAYPPKNIYINSDSNDTGGVYINNTKFVSNNLLWSGAELMNSNTGRINLSESVLQQTNGIVLIFSRYSGGSTDLNFTSFYVPKFMVKNFPGKGNQFFMVSPLFYPVCAKILYIYEKYIKGANSNGDKGTNNNSSITYDNTAYCLRYVLGV